MELVLSVVAHDGGSRWKDSLMFGNYEKLQIF